MTVEKRAELGNGATKNTLKYSPKNIRKSFWYKGKLLYLRSIPEEGYSQRERFFLSYMGTSSGILKEFLHDCHVTLEKQTESKTAIYMNGDGRWDLATRRAQKRTNTVILPDDVKNDFFNDLAEYLDPEAVAWYVEHGQLYSRGYLLHGEPGTGKTSLSLAAAGKFGLDVYAMNLSKVNDATLHKLLSKLPARCILLLEDIDAIESAKSRENSDAGSSTSSSVTLSGLLNAIDGAGSVEGRVLIMTTNYVDRLDPAVIRPRRVDKMVEFGLASREMLLELFRYIYTPLSSKTERAEDADEGAVKSQDEGVVKSLLELFRYMYTPLLSKTKRAGVMDEGAVKSQDEGAVKSQDEGAVKSQDEGAVKSQDEGAVKSQDEGAVKSQDEGAVKSQDEGAVKSQDEGAVKSQDEGAVKNQDAQDIQELAVKFADRVPEMKYSPAKILSFLIAHKHSPQDAVENVISWMNKGGEDLVPLRRQTSTMHKKNEDTFDLSDVVSAGMGMEDLQWFTISE